MRVIPFIIGTAMAFCLTTAAAQGVNGFLKRSGIRIDGRTIATTPKDGQSLPATLQWSKNLPKVA